jgi:hypothetical protein
MRRTMIGLGVAVLVAIGCSDSDGGGEATDTGGDDGGSGGGSAEQFCEDFQALDERFANDPEAANDPTVVLAALEELNPPDEIADDFQQLLELSRVQAELDPSDQEAVDEFERLGEESTEAQERFASFIDEECALDDESDDTTDTTAAE